MPDDLGSLHRLLDLPLGASPDAIRFSYDQRMAAAVRGHDHRRALELSSALDALPVSLRDAIYPCMTTRTPHRGSGRVPPAAPGRAARRRSADRTGLRRRVTRKDIVLALIIMVGFGYWAFWHATHLSGNQPATVAWPANSTVTPALYLDDRYGRDDVSCRTAAPPAGGSVLCEASDGSTWTVVAGEAPNSYRVTATTPSVYERSARVDAEVVAGAVRACRAAGATRLSGVHQMGRQLRFHCGVGRATRTFLKPGDHARVTRQGRRFVIEVVASDGEIARADVRARHAR